MPHGVRGTLQERGAILHNPSLRNASEQRLLNCFDGFRQICGQLRKQQVKQSPKCGRGKANQKSVWPLFGSIVSKWKTSGNLRCYCFNAARNGEWVDCRRKT